MAEKKVVLQGRKVKDFSLKDQNGQDFHLSEYRGEKVLLSFHPLAWTPVCAKQMQTLEKNKRSLDKLNTVAVGLSVDSVPSKAAWAKSLRIKNTRLLADFWPHGAVAKSMGILRVEGFSERANVIVNEAGKIIFVKVYPIRELPDIGEILRVLTAYKGNG
ncbi:MAG TPA: redoxin domain-containing protein [Syntrophales bacterium]|jgi:peroxiredoxin